MRDTCDSCHGNLRIDKNRDERGGGGSWGLEFNFINSAKMEVIQGSKYARIIEIGLKLGRIGILF